MYQWCKIGKISARCDVTTRFIRIPTLYIVRFIYPLRGGGGRRCTSSCTRRTYYMKGSVGLGGERVAGGFSGGREGCTKSRGRAATHLTDRHCTTRKDIHAQIVPEAVPLVIDNSTYILYDERCAVVIVIIIIVVRTTATVDIGSGYRFWKKTLLDVSSC